MAGQTQPRRASRPTAPRLSLPGLPAINWPWFLLAALLVGYWWYAASLERVDANLLLARIFLPDLPPSQAAEATFSPWITLLVEMFHPRVLRHLIPIVVGWWLAVQAAISLMQVLYDCPDRRTAAEFLRRQRRDSVNPLDIHEISAENLHEEREKSILLGVGGPVRVQIPDGYAAVTERNARTLRSLPPGTHNLGRFEYVQGLVDLQPLDKSAKDVPMLTREGIPVKVNIGLAFRIDPGDLPVTHSRPFPFREEAVRQAVYSGAVGANGVVSSWEDGPLGKVRGALSGMVAEDSLDELLAAESPRDAHHLLTSSVMRKVWDGLPKEGIKPLRMQIGRLTPPPEVLQQYTEFWLANKRKEDMLARADRLAPLVEEAETARVAAEIAMINAVAEGIRRAQQEAGSYLPGYLLALRLMEALRRMFQHSADDLESVGGDTLQLLDEMGNVEERLENLQNQLQLPQPKFRPSSPD